ncbi:MAG: hypothetical protein ABIS36_19130 [Chryseolinea sp.]
MKTAYKCLLVAVLIISSGAGIVVFGQTAGAMTLASYSEEKEDESGMATSEFLNSCVVLLTKNMNACRFVVREGNASDLTVFANKMIEDDSILLSQVRRLAAKLDVSVPYSSELNAKFYSSSFDDDKDDADYKFTEATTRDLGQTIDAFRIGVECNDRWVRAFAAANLSTIENQLIQIRQISRTSH